MAVPFDDGRGEGSKLTAEGSSTHLHVHSEFSLLDGLGRITDLVSQASAQGFDSLALTDHGALYGAVAFFLPGHETHTHEHTMSGVVEAGSTTKREPWTHENEHACYAYEIVHGNPC